MNRRTFFRGIASAATVIAAAPLLVRKPQEFGFLAVDHEPGRSGVLFGPEYDEAVRRYMAHTEAFRREHEACMRRIGEIRRHFE